MADCDHKEVRSTHHCPTGVHVGVCIQCFTVVHVCAGELPEDFQKFLPKPGDATAYIGALQDLYRVVERWLAGKADRAEVQDAFEYVEPERVQLDAPHDHGPGQTETTH